MDENIVEPIETRYHSEAKVVIIPLDGDNGDCFSVGIVEDETPDKVRFPFDWDRVDLDSARRTADRVCKGYWGLLEEMFVAHPFYMMDFPVKRR